jgi:hypothetical protein
VTDPSIVYCTHCGAAVNLPAGFCGSCGQPLPVPAQPVPAAQMPNPQPAYGAVPQQPIMQCPFCHSTQLQAGKRGWKWTTGYIGSGQIVMTCLQCGKKFKPA